MSSDVQDRLVSASEVERWCYCPLSWKLEREGSAEERGTLDKGMVRHRDFGNEAGAVKLAQKKGREDRLITWTFLLFSALLLLMGSSLIVVTEISSIDIDVWKVGVVFLSVLMIGISVVYYFYRRDDEGRMPWEPLGKLFRGMDSRSLRSNNTPLLFYFYGLLLLVNSVILLRPFGIGKDVVTSFLAGLLLLLYIILLVSFTLYFRSRRSDIERKGSRMGGALVLMLLISLSVLFIFISDKIDKEGQMGWVFLFISLLWFIGAIGYDLLSNYKADRRKEEDHETQELPIAALALLASVFTASTFLAKGDNLDEYYLASMVMAGAWLIGAAFFFWRGIHQKRAAVSGLTGLSLPPDARVVTYDDPELRKGSKPLTSRRHFLVGTPDMLIEEAGMKVPVEVKTGRIPPKPHFSHIMQLSAYMLLTDVAFEQDTPYGYLEYAPARTERKRFRIEWDIMTKALVLSKVSEIREAERTGVVHRNHEREGKCRNCSRRQGCPERMV
ncbi:MAG: Dna2/Cas4 domain-containing protein [Thermoplasmatota archaeon]